MDRKKKILFIILLFGIGLVIYVNSLNNQFIWDDEYLVKNNSFIKSPQHLGKIFSSNLILGGGGESNFYRPIISLSFLLDYSLCQLKPFGYHLTNILIHILNAILIYAIFIALTQNFNIAAFTSLFFLVHPVQTEAVTYISGRADLLMTLFLLSTFALFVKQRESGNRLQKTVAHIASLFAFLLALLSKEVSLIFPFLLLAYCFYFRKQSVKNMYLPLFGYFVLEAIYIAIRIALFGLPAENVFFNPTPLYSRLVISCKTFVYYLGFIFFPTGLHMERTLNISGSLFEPDIWLSLLLFMLVVFFIIKLYKRFKISSFGLVWFIICLIPTLPIFNLNAFIAEHWLYLPSIGIFAAITNWSNTAFTIMRYRRTINVLYLLLIACASFLTIRQNTYWKDESTLYAHILKFEPENVRIHYNLGHFYYDIKSFAKAAEHYKKAEENYKKVLNANANDYKAHNDLGVIYTRTGKIDEAINELKTAIKLKPDYSETYYNLGLACDEKGLPDEALKYYEKSIAINPYQPMVHYNIGVIYDKNNDMQKAIAKYKEVIALDPYYIAAYVNLGALLAQEGQFEKAREIWQKGLKIKPDELFIKRNLEKLWRYSRRPILGQPTTLGRRRLP